MGVKYLSLNEYLKNRFGTKVYKLSLSTGFSCPNRDGRCGVGGCIFCSSGGSGDFAASAALPVAEQIKDAKERVKSKLKTSFDSCRYIAYFQSFTSTYGSVERQRELFFDAIKDPEVVVLSIATRPDCLPDEVLDLLDEINRIKPVWVELGLQTIHEETARFINRGYELSVYNEAVNKLRARGIDVITHLILGLPKETPEMMLQSVDYVAHMPVQGVKLQLLHILKGTALGNMYEEAVGLGKSELKNAQTSPENIPGPKDNSSKFNAITPENLLRNMYITELDQYVDLVLQCLKLLPDSIVVHRLTGDAPRKDLLYPLWSSDKKRILNEIKKRTQVY